MNTLLFNFGLNHRILASLVCLILFSSTLDAKEIRNDIPPRAFEYRDVLVQEIDRLFPELPEYNFIPALIEHESCISLTHSRCWSSTSQLKTSREQGLGFFQPFTVSKV